MTVDSCIIKSFLAWAPGAVDVPLKNGLRVQILPGVQDLAWARKQQCAAFIAAEGLLVVWDDDAMHLIERATGIQEELMHLVWKTEAPAEGATADNVFGTAEKEETVDVETGEMKPQKRPRHKQNAVLVSLALCLITASIGAALRQLDSDRRGTGVLRCRGRGEQGDGGSRVDGWKYPCWRLHLAY